MSRLHRHTISRKFSVDMGHRVHNHESKCANLHGHTYTFTVSATAEDLDDLGRVVDFSVMKRVGEWLEENWDHGMVLYNFDPINELYGSGRPLGDMKHYLLPSNPTAENLGSHLLIVAQQLLNDTGVRVVSVKCQETPNCDSVADVLSA